MFLEYYTKYVFSKKATQEDFILPGVIFCTHEHTIHIWIVFYESFIQLIV